MWYIYTVLMGQRNGAKLRLIDMRLLLLSKDGVMKSRHRNKKRTGAREDR
jgi:hypothetical protein